MPRCLLSLASAALLPALLCTAPALRAQAPSPQLASVLAQMDAGSKSFQSASANFEWDFYEKIVKDTSKQKGSMYIDRGGAHSNAGASFGAVVYDLNESGKPNGTPSKVIDYSGGSLRVYTPSEKQVDMFKAGANQTHYESYLTLGFGGSGHDLANTWQITDGGPETIAGVKTERLLLVSKDPAVRNTFTRVTIWIDPVRDISLKQVFDTPSGDQRTAFYSDIVLNKKINKDPFKIPKDVTVLQH